MQFDQYTITLLISNPDGPDLDEEAAAKLQDAHMAHIADLHKAGHLLVAGPLFDDRLRGLSILKLDADRALELEKGDPAVRAGVYTIQAIPWVVPSGAMTFAPSDLPRSMAQAQGE
jgi:uncharacterized protein YciI